VLAHPARHVRWDATNPELAMPEQIRCPSCASTLRVPDDLLGKTVKCPRCQTTFTAAASGPAGPEGGYTEEPARPARRPAPPPEEEETGYDEGPDEDRPRRRARYEDDEDEDRPRRRIRRRSSEALSAVAGPAIALMITGGLSIALGILSLALNLLGVGLAAAGPAGPKGGANNVEAMAQTVGGVAGAIVGICLGGVITAGAVKMKNLQSYGFAMTACILAILPCHSCCLLGIPFGIWGLVMLNKPGVKDAFS
jgi:predicted Zn finger-like uncharacterized protein